MKKNYFVAASLLVGMLSFGQVGNSLRFDGVNDRVIIPNTTQNSVGIPHTFETNIFIDAAATAQVLAKNGWTLKLNNNNSVTYYVQGTGGALVATSAANSLTLKTWHHIAGVANGATMKLYIDGVEAQSIVYASTTLVNAALGNVVLGTDVNFGGHFAGALDEIRVWNVARTPAELAANKTTELAAGDRTGLVAYYQCNQGTAGGNNTSITTLTDSSVNNNPGTLTNFTMTGNNSNFVNTTILPTQSFAIDSKTQIFPNPATNEVTINHTDLTNVAVKVTDIAGKVLINESLNEASNTLNIANLNAGIYLFTISSNEGQTTKKIVKK